MLKYSLQSLSNILFPPICFYCEEMMPTNKFLLCSSCQKKIQLSYPTIEDHENQYKFAAVFEPVGPIMSLYRRMKLSGQISLCKTFAAYMVLQWGFLNDHFFVDEIVPILSSKIKDSYLLFLAKEMGKIMNCPVRSMNPILRKNRNHTTILYIVDFLDHVEKKIQKIDQKEIFILSIF